MSFLMKDLKNKNIDRAYPIYSEDVLFLEFIKEIEHLQAIAFFVK